MAMLEVNHLAIQFGGLRAVDGFNVSIEKGQLYGLIGPNGAGKTTIFNLLTGVYKPTEGIIKLDGQDITGKKIRLRSTGQVLQELSRISVCLRICRFLTMLRSDFTISILILH